LNLKRSSYFSPRQRRAIQLRTSYDEKNRLVQVANQSKILATFDYVVSVKDLEEDQWKAGRNAEYPGLPRKPP
jgi:hypothetical protein